MHNAMERLRLSPRAYSRITFGALIALAFIVVTGGAVRLTGSGLGCPDWPTCDAGRVVAPLEYHAMVEFVNRTVTGIVSVAVMLAVLGSLLRRPRRRDLTWLSIGLVGGVLGQIVLGGMVVLFHLAPGLVMAHFGVSMLLLLDATVLHDRAGQPDGPVRATVGRDHIVVIRLLLAGAALVILLGTVVTGAGPHAGSRDGQLVERLPLAIASAARLHSIAVLGFGAMLLFVLRGLRRAGAAGGVLRAGRAVLVVTVAQAAVGYAQYFTGVPALLVAVHIAGAAALWVTVVRFSLATHVRVPAEAHEAIASQGSVVAPASPAASVVAR